jgi:hypothetical protein
VFYRAWDQISRNREIFAAWVEQNIRNTQNFGEYLKLQSDAKAQAAYP